VFESAFFYYLILFHTQTHTHASFSWVWRSKISTHSNPHSLCFFGCGGAKYPHTQTHTHSVFSGVEEQNNLTLKLKLTLFFLGVKQDNVLTLTLKLTLIFPPRRGIWIIWDNPVLGTKASVRVSLSMESMSSHSNSHSHSHQCPHFFNFIQPFFSPG
jgi:hypothetical protein